MKKTLLIVFVLAAFIISVSMVSNNFKTQCYHSDADIEFYKQHKMQAPPMDSDEYFLTPPNCGGCHGFDPQGLALVDQNGRDVNIYDDWQTSMMGLSAIDPFWRAKVSHEILTNPGNALEAQTFCTRCHAPMGHYSAMFKGAMHYTIDSLNVDSLGLAGVGCSGCHAISPDNLGSTFNGIIPYDTNNIEYGPFDSVMQGPMQLYVGITPMLGTHMNESRSCAPCHTLQSATLDLSGNATGNIFTEQATYHEWLNSAYPAQPLTCQNCHMPQIEDAVKIAVGYTALPGRSPFNIHTFAGANKFMVELIKNNKAALNVVYGNNNFDSTIKAITTILQTQTLKVKASADSLKNDTAYVNVSLTNYAGHKFPSGYPSRRAVLQMLVVKDNGDTLFASGLFDNNFELHDVDTSTFEQHYNVITDSSQVQIYEMVMADVAGNKTTVLERADTHLKDNRIPPLGFTSTHFSYDTVKVVGHALTDADFNKVGLVEGTGKDIVHFHIPLKGYTGKINVYTNVYYQTLPLSFLNEMQSMTSAPIDSFLQMYAAADKTPAWIDGDTLLNILNPAAVADNQLNETISISPNPTTDGIIFVNTDASKILSVKIFSAKGDLISRNEWKDGLKKVELQLPQAKGIYIVQIRTSKGSIYKKVMRL